MFSAGSEPPRLPLKFRSSSAPRVREAVPPGQHPLRGSGSLEVRSTEASAGIQNSFFEAGQVTKPPQGFDRLARLSVFEKILVCHETWSAKLPASACVKRQHADHEPKEEVEHACSLPAEQPNHSCGFAVSEKPTPVCSRGDHRKRAHAVEDFVRFHARLSARQAASCAACETTHRLVRTPIDAGGT